MKTFTGGFFMVRLTAEDRRLIELLAKRLGESKSVIVRKAVRSMARREKIK